jgi:hypothetical protein
MKFWQPLARTTKMASPGDESSEEFANSNDSTQCFLQKELA